MTVFLLTDRTELLSVEVKGSTGSALIDISKITMYKLTESGRKEQFTIDTYDPKDFTKGCSFLFDSVVPQTPEQARFNIDPGIEPVIAEERATCLSDAAVAKRL